MNKEYLAAAFRDGSNWLALRRLAARFAVILLLIALFGGAQHCLAQEQGDPNQSIEEIPQAVLFIHYDARARRGDFILNVRDAPDARRPSEPIFERAIAQGFGDTTLSVMPASDTVWHSAASDDVEYWETAWTTGTAARQGFARHPFLVESTFDPRPLQRVLREHKITYLRLDVEEVVQGASIARCDGIDPFDGDNIDGRRVNRQSSVYYQYLPDIDSTNAVAPMPTLHFRVGFSAGECWERLLPPVLLLTLPLLVLAAFIARVRAMAAVTADVAAETGGNGTELSLSERRSQIWFGFVGFLSKGGVVFSYTWIFVSLALRPASLLLWIANPATNESRVLMGAAFYLLPPIAALTLADLLTRPVHAELRGRRISVREMLINSGGRLIAVYLPFTFIAVALAASMDGIFRLPELPSSEADRLLYETQTFRCVGWLMAIGVASSLLAALTYLSGANKVVRVGEGALYRRVMTLAKEAGVKIRGIQFLTTGNYRTANAFALQRETVMFTDYLINELSTDEVDAIIAHELAHVKRGHLKKRAQPLGFLGGLTLGAGIVSVILPDFFDEVGNTPAYRIITLVALPIIALVCYVLSMNISRKQEREADLDAVRLTGRPADLITGLARIEALSGLPRQWNRWQERLLTHPSTQRRIQYLAEEGAITPPELEDLLASVRQMEVSSGASAETTTAREHYALPHNAIVEQRVFSALTYTRLTLIHSWTLIAILFLVETIVAMTLQHIPGLNSPGAFLTVQSVAGVVSYLLYGGLTYLITLLVYPPLEKQLSQMLTARSPALRAAHPEQVTFVGLTPGKQPRLYNNGGALDWDMGYLIVAGDFLRFIGEKTAFCVTRDRVTEISNGIPWPGWVPTPRTVLRWEPENDDSNELCGVTLRLADAKATWAVLRETSIFRERLQQWWRAPNGADGAEDDLPDTPCPMPLTPDEKGISPAAFVTWSSAWKYFRVYAAIVLACEILSNQRGSTILGTLIVLAIFVVVSLVPSLCYREPKSSNPVH